MPTRRAPSQLASSSNRKSRLAHSVDLDFKRMRMLVLAAVVVAAVLETFTPLGTTAHADSEVHENDTGPNPTLEAPDKQLIPRIKIAEAVGWNGSAMPNVPAGFSVNAFTDQLDHPRWLYVLPNGDVLAAETNAPERKEDRKGIRGWFMKKAMQKAGAATMSANRISLLRDADGDGIAETRTVFAQNLNSPFGMALVGESFYVANTDAIVMYRYRNGATALEGAGEKIVDLPAGDINHHWTKNLLASADGKKLYVTVGSNSNVAENGLENERNRAAILEVDPANRTSRVFASGLRNPNGLAWHPRTKELWTAVNERDEIGDNLVPDYITAVHDGEFFGWPFVYYGDHVDARAPKSAAVATRVEKPDFALGSHTASLGLAFYDTDRGAGSFPARFRNGAFVSQHGSWNRSEFSGYKVVFVRFDGDRPVRPIEDFMTGFLDNEGRAHGRPVGVAVDKRGALLVADDVGNRIWRVSASDGAPAGL